VYINRDDPKTIDRYSLTLDKKTVRTIDRSGGTFLHTSRTNPGKVKFADVPQFLTDPEHPEAEAKDERLRDFTPHVLENLEHLGIERLIPIGGDDTLSYGERLHSEGFPVVAIPKTMDNDVYGTDYCIGFSTAVTRGVQIIHQLRTSAGSHERIAVIELFGRNSGETSLVTSYLAGVDRAIISEVPFNPEHLAELLVRDKNENPSNYAMVTISEGAHIVGGKIIEYGEADAYGHRKLGGIGEIVGEALKKLTGFHILYQRLSYMMRSGAPDALDLMVAVNFANLAMDLISEGSSGRMVSLRDGKYTHIPMSEVAMGVKRVDVDELYDTEQYRPKVYNVLGKPMFLY
jgi:6-phosphofructokinase 1